jgi:nucleotide-binding universal stress UspA family protein
MANALPLALMEDCRFMSTNLILSYDGTPNDDDALALGQMLARTGASLALAYVRHSREFDPAREEIAQHDAERRLEHGVAWLGDPKIPCHIVISGSTGEGLLQLAQEQGASTVVFASDYRTAPGHAEPGASAWRMLEGGTIPVAVAAAGLRTRQHGKIDSISVAEAEPEADGAAEQSARALASRLGATVVPPGNGPADLIIVGSQPSAPPGRIALSGRTRSRLNSMQGSVLVIPAGTGVQL